MRSEVGVSLSDAEWTAYTRLRLGLPVVKPGPCQLVRQSKCGERQVCGQLMDAAGAHCVSCKVGGAVIAAHGEGCQILADATREAGYTCRREQVTPELATDDRPSPVMDCDAWGVAGAERLLIDFTLRAGGAARYGQGSRAAAAASAEADKLKAYPTQNGVSVRGVAMEVLGKHGPELQTLLHELADRARATAIQQGRAPARHLHRWRCQLACMCARFVGRQAAQSQASAARAWEATDTAQPVSAFQPSAPIQRALTATPDSP